MGAHLNNTIVGTGSYIPCKQVRNEAFLSTAFYEADQSRLSKANQEITDKFFEITSIEERRYVADHLKTSDIATMAAEDALSDAGIDRESLDYIIVAHNFGDVAKGDTRSDMVPSLAARVKHQLKIHNPNTVAYDMIFGCPGWLESLIQAHYFLKSGEAKRALVIGADTLSRIYDPHDRDGMLYADGAGAVVLEAKEGHHRKGILAHKTRSDTLHYSQMLYMGPSYNPANEIPDALYLKMHGRKLYQYALETVPAAIKECLEATGIPLEAVKKVLIHQANGKMDDAILARLYKLYGIEEIPEGVMPMTVSWLGNSSVATVPTLLDLIRKGELEGQHLDPGDIVIFASVGAGMNVNAMVYRV